MIIRHRYRTGEILERSPLDDVFLAEDMQTGLLVVIRALNRQITIDPDVLAAFESEMAILRELALPTMAPYHDIFFFDDRLHLVRPYLPGQSLEEYLAQHGPLSSTQFQNWAISLARSLHAAHINHVVHGDLRPRNIFVVAKNAAPPYAADDVDDAGDAYSADGRAEEGPAAPYLMPAIGPDAEPDFVDTPGELRLVIVDAGLHRLLENRRLATTTARLNLSNYTSPQRWIGQPPGISDDIWNLGVLFFQFVGGRLPFDADSDAAIMDRVLHFATPNLRGRVPRGFVAIIERCLEKDPWRRYRSLGAVIFDLERGSVRWPGRRTGLMPRRWSPVVSWVLFIALLLLIISALAGGGAMFVARYRPTPTAIRVAAVIISPTPSDTPTPVILPFQTAEPGQAALTMTPSATWTPLVITNTPAPTDTPSATPTAAPTDTSTPTLTVTATATATPSPTVTASASPTATVTPSPSATASLTATATATITITPSPTVSATPTATATATANASATADYDAFVTRAAVIRATQVALATLMAPVDPDLDATSIALTPAAAALAVYHTARTADSALPLCAAGENLVAFTDFRPGVTLPGAMPEDFTVEQIGGDTALHLTHNGTWTLPIPRENIRLRFDMLAPAAVTPPLTVSFVPQGTTETRIGWRLNWRIAEAAAGTGLLLEQVRGGQPETVSSLVSAPFNEWITVDMGFQPIGQGRTIFTLTVFSADGPHTALLVLSNDALTPLVEIAINGSIDSAPWLDNVLICHRQTAPVPTPTPLTGG